MRCSSPIHAYYLPRETKDGKKHIYFLNISKDDAEFYIFHNHGRCQYELLDIPCGHCIECRINKSQEWATRSCLESLNYNNNYFVTLTYEDERIPILRTLSRQTGTIENVSNLQYEDIQQFLKNLRRYFKYHFNIDNIRFLVSGEYGSKFGRAHWHLLLFNCPLPDLKFLKIQNGNIYYTSDIISQCWNNKGYNIVGNVEFCSSAYVARYVLKKFYGGFENEYQLACKQLGVQPQNAELIQMSRRPGLAFEYFRNNITTQDFINANKIILENGRKSKIPRYFERVFLEHPEEISDFEDFILMKDTEQQIIETYHNELKNRSLLLEQSLKRSLSCSLDEYRQKHHDYFVSNLREREFDVK